MVFTAMDRESIDARMRALGVTADAVLAKTDVLQLPKIVHDFVSARTFDNESEAAE